MATHTPAHTIDALKDLKKKEAVAAYETEAMYLVDMGKFLPDLDDEHREDVEIAVADMERQVEWLRSAEDVLSERNLQGGVEEETKTSVTKALVQLRDAQEKIGEWRAEDARREQEARDAEAAAERKEAHARAMRKLEAQAAEARRRAAQNKAQAAAEGSRASTSPSKPEVAVPKDTIELNTDGEEEDTLPRIGKRRDRKGKRKAEEVEDEEPGTPTTPRRRLRRRGNTRPMAETSDAEGKAGERSESVAEPGLPTDVSVYGEYDPSVPGSHPRSLEWGCGADAAKNKPCPHPEVQFTGARRCLHCQSANSDCVGSGCRACAACRSRKSTCSFVKSRRRKAAGGEASGSGGAGIREVGTGVRGRGRRTPGTAARETPRATRASTTATALPILRPSHVDRELRDLHQTLANLESRAAALNAAQAELNRIRTATLANLGAAILRREQQWAEAADLAEREENDGADEGEEEIEEDGAEWYA
ncbi:hypothetical protein EYR36_005577 [Pleurotus pulmonarius]|nr:hypothetical protein EYR36_005577 [Pleurotus pulmonarius]